MTCQETRRAIRQRFDRGLPLSAGLEGHVAVCARCAAYLDRLVALDAAFGELPQEGPFPGLAQRLRAGVAAAGQQAPMMPSHRVVAGIAVAVLGIAAAVGWLYPLSVRPAIGLTRLTAYVPQMTLQDAGAWLSVHVQALWRGATSWNAALPLPPLALWALAGVLALFIVVFNLTQVVGGRERVVRSDNGTQ